MKLGERAVIRHVAPHRRDGNKPLLDSVVIGAILTLRAVHLFADPVVSLAARVSVFGDNRARAFDSLPRDSITPEELVKEEQPAGRL